MKRVMVGLSLTLCGRFGYAWLMRQLDAALCRAWLTHWTTMTHQGDLIHWRIG